MDQVISRKLGYRVDLSDIHNLTAEISMRYENPVKQQVDCIHEASYGQEISYKNMMDLLLGLLALLQYNGKQNQYRQLLPYQGTG